MYLFFNYRLIDWLIDRFLYFTYYLFIYFIYYLFIYLFTCLFICLFIYSFVYLFICSQEYCVKILIFLHVFVNFFCEYFYLEIIGFWNQIAR